MCGTRPMSEKRTNKNRLLQTRNPFSACLEKQSIGDGMQSRCTADWWIVHEIKGIFKRILTNEINKLFERVSKDFTRHNPDIETITDERGGGSRDFHRGPVPVPGFSLQGLDWNVALEERHTTGRRRTRPGGNLGREEDKWSIINK